MAPRQTKLVATLGPASSSPAMLTALIEAGVDVVRFNFSHGTHEEHGARLALVRQVAAQLSRPVAVLQDLQGPKIRVGRFAQPGGGLLRPGARFTITTRDVPGDETAVSTTYENLPADVGVGDPILLDDGRITLRVVERSNSDVVCAVVRGGRLSDHKGINLPGVAVSAPALTAKDADDLRWGLAHGVDYVALSFVRQADDLAQARALMRAAGGRVPLIAKLEKPQAIDQLEEIIGAADGVMVARGDLGVELPAERVPMLQKQIIREANRQRKLVIVATQMLESMIEQPRPTRAEVSDVANAILDGTDAVMLSGETAVGRYPVEAVATMARVAEETDAYARDLPRPADSLAAQTTSAFSRTISRAARQMAQFNEDVCAIAVFTKSGHSALMVAKERPPVPVYAFTSEETTYRRLALHWGVAPLLRPPLTDIDRLTAHVERELLAQGAAQPDQVVVIMGSSPVSLRGTTNFLKLHRLGAMPTE